MANSATVAPSVHSPDVGNLFVGRGYLSMQLSGESAFTDMGNATAFSLQVQPTLLHHYSSRIGVRKKDLSVVTQLDATLQMTLEEITVRNMAMFVLGTPLASGADSIFLMAQPLYYASLRFTATNVVGAEWNAVFPLVLLSPRNAFQLIAEGSGNWAGLQMQGDIQYDSTSGQFGWVYSDSFSPTS